MVDNSRSRGLFEYGPRHSNLAVASAVELPKFSEREKAFRQMGYGILVEMKERIQLESDQYELLYEEARFCESVLAGNSQISSRLEAVHQLQVVCGQFQFCLNVWPKDQDGFGMFKALRLKLHHIVTEFAKEYGLDAVKLMSDDGNEWIKFAGAANRIDANSGRTIDGKSHAQLLRDTRVTLEKVRKATASVWLVPFKILQKLERLANEFPEPEFADRIKDLECLYKELEQDGYFEGWLSLALAKSEKLEPMFEPKLEAIRSREDDPQSWTDWLQPKNIRKQFGITTDQGWTTFANRFRKEGLIVNRPQSRGTLVSIHSKVYDRQGVQMPSQTR